MPIIKTSLRGDGGGGAIVTLLLCTISHSIADSERGCTPNEISCPISSVVGV
ncbi:MAG: hypothetical protein WCH65_05155 [bacterium]